MLTPFRFRLAVLAIGATWIGVRGLYWNGYYTEDSPGYVTDAIWMAIGNYHARDHVNGLNIGTYAPVALPIFLFGKSELALSLWPLLCSLLGLVSLAGLSGILFGRPCALLAAFLYATYPGDVFFSTVVMPDSMQAGWVSCSIFLVACAYVQSPARGRWYLMGAGLALGISHLIRANDLVLLPVGVAAVAIFSRKWAQEKRSSVLRDTGVYLAGWALVYAVEGLAYFWAAGDFFRRFSVVNRHYGTVASIAQAGLNADSLTIPFSAFAPIMWWIRGGWGDLNLEQAYHGLLFFWALVSLLIGMAALLARSDSVSGRTIAGFSVAAFWFSWPLLYHQFGSQSVTDFVPMHRLSRHLVVYAPGAIFGTVAGVAVLGEVAATWRLSGRRALTAVAAAILLTHLSFNWQGEQMAYNAYHRIKGTYARIRERLPTDVKTIIADPGDLCFFDFWLNPLGIERVRMVAFANYSGCDEIEPGLLLTHSSPGWEGAGAPVIQETVRRLPCLLAPPANWRLLYDGHPERLYAIDAVATQGRSRDSENRALSLSVSRLGQKTRRVKLTFSPW